jgi:RNA polymerase sigma factor (sigma-70 family)
MVQQLPLVQEPTDAALVARAQAGDRAAFGRLIERYEPLALRLASGMARDPETARDLTQEALLQAFLALDQLRDAARFRGWLCGITRNVCRGHLRGRRAPILSLESLAGGIRFEALPFSAGAPDPQEIVEARDLRRRLLAAIASLPPGIRVATRLFYYEQLSLQEIAATLGVSVVAVKSRLHQARARLRAQAPLLDPDRRPAAPDKRRNPPMIPVTIADVVMRDTAAERRCVVVLADGARSRLLPIWIGAAEGAAIALGLRGTPTERPMTYPFMASLLVATGATLDSVEIAALKGDVYYAVVQLRHGDQAQALDARPSDALALAARAGCPVFVADEILDRAGIPVPPEYAQRPLGQGADKIVRELEAQWLAARPALSRTAEDARRDRPELLALVFGDS